MCQPDGTESVDDDEFLHRKIPAKLPWYDSTKIPPVSSYAFNPRENDTTGLSLDRAKYRSVEESAEGQSAAGYYVAILRAGDLRAHGMEVVPRPLPENPGHAEIVGLTYQDRKTDQCREWMKYLAEKLTRDVAGPFSPHI